MGLHVFVAFLQAYIFMLLAMIYVGGAVAHENTNGFIRSEREPAVPQGRLGTTSSRTILYKENNRMKRKLIYSGGALMLLASPIFAQTPAARRRHGDWHWPGVPRHGISRPDFAAWDKEKPRLRLARPGAQSRRRKRASGSHSFSDLVLIESLALYTLVITYVAK